MLSSSDDSNNSEPKKPALSADITEHLCTIDAVAMVVTLGQFANADDEIELCAELTDNEIVHQMLEEDDWGSNSEKPVTVLPTN